MNTPELLPSVHITCCSYHHTLCFKRANFVWLHQKPRHKQVLTDRFSCGFYRSETSFHFLQSALVSGFYKNYHEWESSWKRKVVCSWVSYQSIMWWAEHTLTHTHKYCLIYRLESAAAAAAAALTSPVGSYQLYLQSASTLYNSMNTVAVWRRRIRVCSGSLRRGRWIYDKETSVRQIWMHMDVNMNLRIYLDFLSAPESLFQSKQTTWWHWSPLFQNLWALAVSGFKAAAFLSRVKRAKMKNRVFISRFHLNNWCGEENLWAVKIK